MSGLEIAGVVLGAFPIIISGLEQWQEAARIGKIFLQPDVERNLCLFDLRVQIWLYKMNMKALLIPVADERQVEEMIEAASSPHWRDPRLVDSLEARLKGSYEEYMGIMERMNITVEQLRSNIGTEKTHAKERPGSPRPRAQQQPSPSRLFDTVFSRSDTSSIRSRMKLSTGRSTRAELFGRLDKDNRLLEQLLKRIDGISELERTTYEPRKSSKARHMMLVETCRKADALYRALQQAWQCQCQHHHFANLRLDLCTVPDKVFDVVLMFVAPPTVGTDGNWVCQAMQCGHSLPCVASSSMTSPDGQSASASTGHTIRSKQVAFIDPKDTIPDLRRLTVSDPPVRLCQQLKNLQMENCLGVIGHRSRNFHLHPTDLYPAIQTDNSVSLEDLMSAGLLKSRRERFAVAAKLASAVAQLRLTPWMRSGITKTDILFFPRQSGVGADLEVPFIRQDFASERTSLVEPTESAINLHALGIMLLELCFNVRIEDHPMRSGRATGTSNERLALDRMAAQHWVDDVFDDSGHDYEQAVKWCLENRVRGIWPQDFITHVVEPLEVCNSSIWKP